MIVNIGNGFQNTNHDLHQLIFHIIRDYRNNTDPSLVLLANSNLMPWSKYIIQKICDDLKIKLQFTDSEIPSYILQRYYPHKIAAARISSIDKNYLDHLKYLNNLFNEFNTNNKIKILYTRRDVVKRQLLGTENIEKYFDLVIHDMSKYSPEEQIKLFKSCSHFVAVNGAHMANIVFMDYNTNVMDIQLVEPNSWQEKFGSGKMIKNYKLITANILIDNKLPKNRFSKHGNDFNVMVDEKLSNEIIKFLS